jgi:hypothetical protein
VITGAHAVAGVILRTVEQTALRVDEAVLLAHALAARLAEQVDARILFIKGPTAVAVGARPRRPSSDVDVLVEPAAFERLCAAFESAGWQLRTPIGTLRHAADLAFDHSAHFIHPEWPCDVDVHYLFPGFLADPASVFEALWQDRTHVELAACRLTTADLLGQGLVVGLHALRDPGRTSSREDLAHLVRVLGAVDQGDRAALRALARDTGSSGSAAQLLTSVGVVPAPLGELERSRLADWQRRQTGLGTSTAWLAELRLAPRAAKVRVLRHALLPPREHFVSSHLAEQVSGQALAWMRLRRLFRGMAALPRASRMLRGRRRERGR